MFLLIILLSYLLGCASTVALLLYLYTRYAFYSPVTVNEQPEEPQYEPFHALPENERAKNSAVDTVNYIFQFLFQELKDSSRLRRYLMHKLNTEFNELKKSRTGQIFLQNIVIQDFSIGTECPVFSDIRLDSQERDERHLIKKFVAKLDVDYKNGFSVSLDITLLFGHKCRLSIKVKRIQGNLRLEFRREPFCHWLLVFQDEPTIDFEVKSYFASGESPQLAQIVTQQLRRAIKRKQTWPSYKIRYQPFFPTSKLSVPTEVLSATQANLLPGKFEILIKYCDRLSIPLAVFDKQKVASLSVFLTININEEACADYLHINRDKWPCKEIELQRNTNKIFIKEVIYMDRTELLIEAITPMPDSIEDADAFVAALKDRNVFLMKMQGQEVKTLKQYNRLIKYKSAVVTNDASAPTTTTTSTTGNDDRVQIIVGMPLLHCARVQRVIEPVVHNETDKAGSTSTLSARADGSSPSLPNSLRQRTATPTVKFEAAANSLALPRKPSDGDDDEPIQEATMTESVMKSPDSNATRRGKLTRTPVLDITLMMMNTSGLQKFQAQPTPTKKAEAHVECNDKFEFQVGEKEKYLNICLWCKPPLDCDVPDVGKKLVLLGYATAALSEVVLDAHMSFKRETQLTMNFRSAYSPKPNLDAALTDFESKSRVELSTHKGYDDNLAHGFVTINIRHWPELDLRLNPQEKKEQFLANGPLLTEFCTKLKEDERKQEQLKYIDVINAQQASSTRKQTNHSFEDKTFTVATTCALCTRKIWMKVGRQCRDCQITIHKKCEDKVTLECSGTAEPGLNKSHGASASAEDDAKSLVHVDLSNSEHPMITTTEEVDSLPVKNNYDFVPMVNTPRMTTPASVHRFSTKAAAALSVVLDSTTRRSFRGFGNKPVHSALNITPTLSNTSELSKSEESLSNGSTISSSPNLNKTSMISNPPVHTSSKLANAASSAYSKLREFKTKRLPASTPIPVPSAETPAISKARLSSDSRQSESASDSELRGAISSYLTDENNDIKGLESFLLEKSLDGTALYSKAREFGAELHLELPPDERKQKLETEISRLQQEMHVQCQNRAEMIHECEQSSTDENEKRKLQSRIANIDEKLQALSALTIFYCSGLKHCCAQMEMKESVSPPTTLSIIETPDDDDENIPLDDPQHQSDDDEDDDEEEDE